MKNFAFFIISLLILFTACGDTNEINDSIPPDTRYSDQNLAGRIVDMGSGQLITFDPDGKGGLYSDGGVTYIVVIVSDGKFNFLDPNSKDLKAIMDYNSDGDQLAITNVAPPDGGSVPTEIGYLDGNTVTIPPPPVPQTPVVGDFTIDNLYQTAGAVTAVKIKPLTGKSNGAITIYYDGTKTIPKAEGTYVVTFDVAAATGWEAVTGLSAGTLVVVDTPTQVDPGFNAEIGDGDVTLFWSELSEDPDTTYEVSKDGGTTWVEVGTADSYTFYFLSKTTDYNFKVRYKEAGDLTFKEKTITKKPNLDIEPIANIYATGWCAENNWTVGVPGKRTNYTCSGMLNVSAGETLKILPGTTITFTTTSAGISVASNGTILAEGIARSRITFKGTSDQKGSWYRLIISSTNANVLEYVDFINGGGTSNTNATVQLSGGSAKITNCVIDNSKGYGLYLSGAANTTEFSNNIISRSDNAPICADNSAGIYSLRNITINNTYTDNTNPYVYVSSWNDLSYSMTLHRLPGAYYYRLNGTLTVTSNAFLTVEAGTEIRLANTGNNIVVNTNASISMVGTASAPIIIKGINNSPGAWGLFRIISKNVNNKLDYVHMLYGGSSSGSILELNGGEAAITNCRIENSGGIGMNLTGTSPYPTIFEDNTISGCTLEPIRVSGTSAGIYSLRNITTNNTYTANGNPYINVASWNNLSYSMTLHRLPDDNTIKYYYRFGDNLTVNSTALLTVEAGVEIRLAIAGAAITVDTNAGISMVGTASAPIIITGINNSPGAWDRLQIKSKRGENKLDYVKMSYGGRSNGTILQLSTGEAAITNCLIENSGGAGMYLSGFSLATVFEHNVITGCAREPIYVSGSATGGGINCVKNVASNNTLTGNGIANSPSQSYVYIEYNTTPASNMTLHALDVPYYLADGLNFTTASTLTIDPGVEIWIDSNKGITIGTTSRLSAIGTSAKHIIFRGSDDSAGWWTGITVNTQSEGTNFAYCDISGFGRNAGNRGIYLSYSNYYLQLYNVHFSKGNQHAIGFYANRTPGYHLYASGVTFGADILLGNVYIYDYTAPSGSQDVTQATLPANNWTPANPLF